MTKSQQQTHSDIRIPGWWQALPPATHPYLLLCRIDRPIGWWLLLLPGWWVIPIAAASASAMLYLMVLFLIGAVTMRAAGCVVNDLWDRRLDQKVERTAARPLAAGIISVPAAMLFLAFLGLIGLAVLVQLPKLAILTGIAALPLVVLYPLAKRVTWWPQAVLGLTFSWGVPLGWTAATAALPPVEVGLIYAGTVCWVFGYDTIYAVQDMKDDQIVGVKSSALGLGKYLRHGVLLAYVLAVLLIGAGGWLMMGAGVWMAGLAGMALHLAWQTKRLVADDPAGALKLFKSNRDAGLLLTVGMMVQAMTG